MTLSIIYVQRNSYQTYEQFEVLTFGTSCFGLISE